MQNFPTGTLGFPNEYGLLKIDDEIITYTGITSTSFTGCIRGFSGITDYHQDLNQEELVFSSSSATSHSSGSSVTNLSSLFLKDFYNKFKFTFAPGLEGKDFTSSLNVGNFLKEIKIIKLLFKSRQKTLSLSVLFSKIDLLPIIHSVVDDYNNIYQTKSGINISCKKLWRSI